MRKGGKGDDKGQKRIGEKSTRGTETSKGGEREKSKSGRACNRMKRGKRVRGSGQKKKEK